MGTKNNPDGFDCHAAAHPDEPIFTLRAHDPSAPGLVERWVRDRERRKGPSDRTREAYKTAQAMRRYYCASPDWDGVVPEIPFDPRPDHERREFEPRRWSTGAHTYIGAGVIERRILNSERRKAENSNQARRHIILFPKEERVGKERRGSKGGGRKDSTLAGKISASLNRRAGYVVHYMGRRRFATIRRKADGMITDRRPLVETIKNIPPTQTQAGTTLFERFPDRRIATESRRGKRYSRRGYGRGDRLGHIAHLGRRFGYFDRRHK